MKRITDIILSFFGLLLFSPVIFIISIIIKLTSKGSVFYLGKRVGKNGKVFKIFKFRTMVVGADKIGPSSTTKSDPRVTSIGKFIRKNKLDEIPQLLNVFLGQMSIVGPRPQVEWAVKEYSEEEKRILTVKPGITDFASIKFHNEGELLEGAKDPDKFYMETIHPEKIRLGLEYVNKRSFFTDIKIIFLTIKTIIK